MTGMSNVNKLAGEPSGQNSRGVYTGNEEYGIHDILKVQEIVAMTVTRIVRL